ncbi:Uncharacterised protein [Mycobacteroides abscessus subsp. abscessus]|nr:Uncharacterised protein [Mycobacteroides abscessus subsp. abscessus]
MGTKKLRITVDDSIRRSSEAPFPHCWDRKLCYFELRNGEVISPEGRAAVRDAVRRAYAGESMLFCAWPGQWRTDLFVIDDLEKAAKALGVDLTVPPRSEWTPPAPPSPEEEAKRRWRGIHIRAAYGNTVDEIVRWFKSTRDEVESALAVAPSEEEAEEIAAVAKRLHSNEKAAATRARNKAAKEAAAEAASES